MSKKLLKEKKEIIYFSADYYYYTYSPGRKEIIQFDRNVYKDELEKNLVIKVKCGGYIDNFLDRKDMHYYKDIKKEHLDKLEKINDFKLEKGKSYEVNIRLPIGEDSYLEIYFTMSSYIRY